MGTPKVFSKKQKRFVRFCNWLNVNKWILLLMLFYMGLNFTQLIKPHFVIWDEAVFVGMGKWLFSGGRVGLWEDLRPVIWPIMLGLFWKLGLSPLFWGEALQILLGAGTLWVIYIIGGKVFDKRTGLFAAIFMAITPVFFQYSTSLLTEPVSTFFVLASVLLFLREKHLASGILAGLGFLTRFPHGLALASMIFILGMEFAKKRNFAIIIKAAALILGFFVAVIPFLVFNYGLYGRETNPLHAALRPLIFQSQHANNPHWGVGGNGWLGGLYSTLFYPIQLIIQAPFLLFAFWGIFLGISKRRKYKNAPLILALLGLNLLYYSSIVNKQLRFAIAFLPFISLLAGLGLTEAEKRIARTGKARLIGLWIVTFILLMPALFLNIQGLAWRDSRVHPIVQEFYMYFAHNAPNGTILTADPVPAAYVDALFIPAYQDVATGIYIINKTNRGAARWIIFKEGAYPCLSGDAACISQKGELLRLVMRHELVYNKSFLGEPHLIYRIR